MKNKSFLLPVFILILALVARFFVLFYVTDPQNTGPGWYADVYHHWQIAYLSKEIGFHQGFLRLWDLRGLEYYWGLLHPLILIIGFSVFNTNSVLVPRIVSVIFGSLVCMLIYLINNRYFGWKTALFSSLFFIFFPVTLFSDTVGMQEPLGLFIILLAIYLWPKRAGLSGLLLMMAGMVRSEYWIIGAILLFVILIRTKSFNQRVSAVTAYIALAVLYMKYLLDYTGNAIYPVWTAYLATFIGKWFADVPVVGQKSVVQMTSRVIFGIAFLILLFIIKKKPKNYLYYTIGILNILIFTALHGMGAYVKGWESKVLVDRLLSFPYAFLGGILSVLFIYTIPKKFGNVLSYLGMVIVVVVLLASQLVWYPILKFYNDAKASFPAQIKMGVDIGKYYQGGNVLVPYGQPTFIYGLIHDGKVPGKAVVSEFYDPFFYAPKGENVFDNWGEFRPKVAKWLVSSNINLFIMMNDPSSDNYKKMINSGMGETMSQLIETQGYTLYRVNLDEAKKLLQ